jgi:hypothetical protein
MIPARRRGARGRFKEGGMAWYDIIHGLMGGQDPYDELRQYEAYQNAQNRAAIDASLGTPQSAPAQGAAPNGAGGPTDPNAPPPQGTPPQPNAIKTPPDLGSIILDLQQRNEASQGLNQALGMGFAAISQPRDREMVSKMFNQTVRG